MADKSEFSAEHQEQHFFSDATQIKRQIVKLEKEQQGISKLSQDFKNTSKKVLQNLENDSNYYVSHLKDIEYTEKALAKEVATQEETLQAITESNLKYKESRNIHADLLEQQQTLISDTLNIEVKPKSVDIELKDAEISFEKYTTRYNNYHSVNSFLRDKISGLVKEKKLFEDQNHRYVSELKALKSKILQSIDGCNQNYETREELKSKVIQLQEKNEKEKSNFHSEMLELERLIQEKQEERMFKESKQETRGIIPILTQSKSDLKKEKDIQLLKDLEEFVGYLETFRDYKNTFVQSYEAKEREIKSLFEFICEKYSNIEIASVKVPVDVGSVEETTITRPKDPTTKAEMVTLSDKDLSELKTCALLFNLDIDIRNEENVDYFLQNKINPETYFAHIDYELDKLTLLAALKKAILDSGEEVLGSLRHNSASTLSSEKPSGMKERLVIINRALLEPPHFAHKQFPSVE